ncbi:putative P450 monooxygenase [Xylogone sp. PMI_703]|nr:putative P450 monooxygenase [Xylogone sp. PMI_703]
MQGSERKDLPSVVLPSSIATILALLYSFYVISLLIISLPISHRSPMAILSLLYSLAWKALLAWLALNILRIAYNLLLHPLRAYPGPPWAKVTAWWKTWIEVVQQESMVDVLVKLHEQYGDIVRVGPNELHFAKPSAYHEIYNSSLRWNKERLLYESFGEDHSSFGLLTYVEAKQRKDVLQPMFSRRAILNIQGLIRKNTDHLIEVLANNNATGQSSDLLFAFRCFAIDTVMEFCFSKSVSALDEPLFKAPIVVAMDNSLPTFHVFKHIPIIRKTIFSLPPWLAIKASPDTAGLTHLQVILGKQVKEVYKNPEILKDSEYPTIYHRLLDPEAHKGYPIPDETSLYEEAQTMMFAGGVTVGDTLMTGHFHILDNPELYKKLKEEVRTVWPDLSKPPTYEALEELPLLTATLKESLRMAPGACSPLLRIVPPLGAAISGHQIPPGTIVGMAVSFVHNSPTIFSSPETFNPSRWLDHKSRGLEQWLLSFSKGPRSCLGVNLAWCEMYVALASMLRCFELELDETTREDLKWRDCFTPFYPRRHLHVRCRPVEE